MAAGMLYLNGQETESVFGLTVVSFQGGQAGSGKRLAARAAGGLLGGPARTIPLMDMPQLAGSIDPGIPLGEDTRGILITCLVQEDSYTELTAILDAIKEVCGTGLVEIRGPYDPSRAFYGVLETPDVEPFVPTTLDGFATLTLAFTCPDPYAYALTPDTVSFGATPVDIPIGTAPSTGRDNWSAMIEIVGAAATPTLSYANFRGDTVGQMAFSSSPLAGDVIRIDCGRRRVRKVVSASESNAFGDLVAGYTFPALDPGDASVVGALWPKLSVSSGAASIRYYKAWR